MDERHCRGKRRDGSACQARPLPDRPWCWAHDPDAAERRQQAYRAGGRAKANAVRAPKLVPSQLRPLLTALVAAMKDVRDGRLDHRRASAMGVLAGAIIRLYPVVELEERLQGLEAEVKRGVHPAG